MKLHRCLIALFAALLLLLTGCDETTQEITLNPDGSGKMVYTVVHSLENNFGNNTGTPEARAEAYAAGLIKHSEGIDAWKDVSFQLADDKLSVTFTGTCYFRSLPAVTFISNPGMRVNSNRVWQVSSEDESLTVALAESKQEQAAAAAGTLTDAQVKQQATARKQQFERQWTMFSELLAQMQDTYILHLPAAPASSTIFNAVDEQPATVRLVYDGKQMAEAVRTIVNREGFWEEAVRQGTSMNDLATLPELNEALFGTRGIAKTVVTGPMQPHFNYSAEVVDAQQQMPAMVKALGLGEQALPPASGDGFESIDIIGVQLVREADFDTRILPFNSSDAGFQVAIKGSFSGAILEVEEVALGVARTIEGTSLRRDDGRQRYVQKMLSEDRQHLVFSFPLELPPAESKGIGLLKGEVTYAVADGTQTIDLGTAPLAKGPFGDAYGLSIHELQERNWQGLKTEVTLKFEEQLPAPIKEIRFYNADGVRLNAEESSNMTFNKVVQRGYRLDGKVAGPVRLELILHDNVRSFRIPFEIRNRDWLGRPLP